MLKVSLSEREKEILKRAKFPRELIKEIYGLVIDIKGYSISRYVRSGPLIMGGRNPSSEAGYQNHLEISLQQQTAEKTPQQLLFYGNSPLIAGDLLKVGVLAAKREYIDCLFNDLRILNDKDDLGRNRGYVLVPREFNEKEEALYLKIIRDGKEIRTDFSVNWNPEFYS